MIYRVSSLDSALAVLHKRLVQLKISRSATRHFPGMKTESLNNYYSRGQKSMDWQTVVYLLEGAGLEIYVREIPRSSAERKAWKVKFAQWMTEAGILLPPDSEVQEPQLAKPGRVLKLVSKGRATEEEFVEYGDPRLPHPK